MSKRDFQKVSDKKKTGERLPCRGCTRKCNNYKRCDGRPWRLIDNVFER